VADAEPDSVPFNGTRIATVTDLDAWLSADAADGDFWFDMPIDQSLDPLSARYRDSVLAYYRSLAGESRPSTESPGLSKDDLAGFQPSPYATGDGAQVGSWLQAIGFIIETCRPRRGHRVLQLGAGQGGLALPLAQMGCTVTALDADRRNIDIIRDRSERAGVVLRALHAGFDTAIAALPEQRFDVVVFHACFHTSYDHVALLRLVREQLLAPGGRLVLAGEPMLETLPAPWGLNPAGPAASAMRRGGALSLVFRPSYLLHALSACGYGADLLLCPQSALGHVIIARRLAI
jgi:SAM-dependent methyltransferase